MKYLSYILSYLGCLIFVPLFFIKLIPSGLELGAIGVLAMIYMNHFFFLSAALAISLYLKSRDDYSDAPRNCFLIFLGIVILIDFIICSLF